MRSIKALSLALLIIALGALPVMATTVSGNASWGQPLEYRFTTDAGDAVTVTLTWTSKKSVAMNLVVRHLTDPNDLMSADQSCNIFINQAGEATVHKFGDGVTGEASGTTFTCTFANGPAGDWHVLVRPTSGGKTPVTLTVTS